MDRFRRSLSAVKTLEVSTGHDPTQLDAEPFSLIFTGASQWTYFPVKTF